MKVLNIGSLNIDLVNRVDHIVRPGETAPVLSFARFAGGKGLNQSVALARAGAKVLHAGAIGADGLFLKELLESEGVDCSGVAVLNDVPTGYALIQVAKDGENAILVNGGANHAVTPELAEKRFKELAKLRNAEIEDDGTPSIFYHDEEAGFYAVYTLLDDEIQLIISDACIEEFKDLWAIQRLMQEV